MKAVSGLLLPLALLITGITPASARELNKDFQESFPVAEGSSLHLVHGDGDVTIEPWDKDELDIRIRYHVKHDKIGLGSDPDFEVEFRQDDETIHVIGHEKDVVVVGFSTTSQYEYTYTIHAPAYLQLDLDGDDGDVQITGWRGDIRAANEDGDFLLSDITAARTEDGDILVEVEPGTSATFNIDTDDGEIVLDLPTGEITAHDDEAARGKLAGGDGRIKIRTDDGTVQLSES